MKRFSSLLLVCLLIILTACTEAPTSEQTLQESLELELDRISTLIPHELSQNILLPSASETFEVVYILEGAVLDTRIVLHRLTPVNETLTLKIIVSKDGETSDRIVALVNIGDEDSYNEDVVLLEQVEAEFHRIKALIPLTYEESFALPTSEEMFVVNYYMMGDLLTDFTVPFFQLKTDQEIVIEIHLEIDEISFIESIVITQIGDLEKYNQLIHEYEFSYIIDQVGWLLPSRFNSNVTLPLVDDVSIVYSVDCTIIERGRVVYTFPDEDQNCSIEAIITYNDETRTADYPFVMSSFDNLPRIPQMHINTVGDAEITSNEIYTNAHMTVYNVPGLDNENLYNVPLEIRLRGNSTLYMPKKSYKIKFNEKQELFGDYSERRWVLLANHVDQSLVRDYVAFKLADKISDEFAPCYHFVDVYVNGEYQGNYLLTDQVEVSNDRIDVEENTSDIDTGYLVEYDIGLYRIGLEESGENYFLIDGIPFVIKSPEHTDEHYVDEQKDYIEEYFNLVLQTLKNYDDYTELIDEATFIDWFIVNEIFKNVDSGYSSVYFHMDKGGKLKMGPVWDFDISSGVPGYVSEELRGPTGWWTPRADKNVFFYYLMQYPEFRQSLKDRWNELYDPVILSALDDVFIGADSITHSRYNNFEKWDIIGVDWNWYTSPEVYDIKTYDGQVWFLYDFLEVRIEWMNQEINNLD